ncbi:MAG: hypothetical protein R6T85_05425 [Egibacteraceae bacterium]
MRTVPEQALASRAEERCLDILVGAHWATLPRLARVHRDLGKADAVLDGRDPEVRRLLASLGMTAQARGTPPAPDGVETIA